MDGTTVTQQSPVLLLLRVNQVKATRAEESAEEVVPEEAVAKDVTDEAEYADTSTALHTHYQ